MSEGTTLTTMKQRCTEMTRAMLNNEINHVQSYHTHNKQINKVWHVKMIIFSVGVTCVTTCTIVDDSRWTFLISHRHAQPQICLRAFHPCRLHLYQHLPSLSFSYLPLPMLTGTHRYLCRNQGSFQRPPMHKKPH